MKNSVLISFLFLMGLGCTKPPMATPPNETVVSTMEKSQEMPSIKIELSDRACKQASDCEQIPTACSCSCGEGVNKLSAAKYADSLTQMCKDYNGKMCKVRCEGQVKCKDNVCTYVNK